MNRYHDTEWGVAVHDDRKIFESLVLEGMQAGLSWMTILKKRENFRKAFDNFDPKKVSRYNERKIRQLMADPGIIRNRLKLSATVANARSFIAVQREFGTFDDYIWGFVKGRQIVNRWKAPGQPQARTAVSDRMSRGLKERGFRFVGSATCYSHMQATGMVNGHIVSCFRYKECSMKRT